MNLTVTHKSVIIQGLLFFTLLHDCGNTDSLNILSLVGTVLLDWFAVGTQTPTARQSNMIKEKEENKQPARTKIYIGSH